MQSPLMPDCEAQRIAELHELCVLDTPAEDRYDRYTRLAQRLFGVEIALVSLVDSQRQWFKSRQGLDATETPRDVSFCGHAILSDEALVVQDASLDERFHDNPLVLGPPNIRFYAGMPLHGPQGQRLGTLCVIDSQPRELSAQDLATLADLAHGVEQELELGPLRQRARLTEETQQQLGAAHEAQARFATIVESSNDAIIGTSVEGVILSWNPAAERIFGYTRDDAIGQSVLMLVPPELGDEAQSLIDRVASGESVHGLKTHRVCRNWEQVTVTLSVSPVRNAAGEVVGACEIARDISDQHRVGEQLRESEDRYQLAVRASNAGLWDWDIAANTAYFSPRLNEMLGHATTSLAAHFSALTDVVHPDDKAAVRGALDAHLAGRSPRFSAECRLQTLGVGFRWFSMQGEALRNELGLPYRMAGSLIDVHERTVAQSEIRTITAMLQSVLEAATGFAVIATDLEGVITVFNRGAENLLGYHSSEVVGRMTPMSFVRTQELDTLSARLSAQLDRPLQGMQVFAVRELLGQPVSLNYVRKDGSEVAVSTTVTARRDEHGQRIGYVGIAYDVTRQREYEASLREARVKAEQASVAKSQFLANMSHELRTPMNAILGMLQLLGHTALTERQRDYVTKTDGAARSLLTLLNDILDFSKVEAGQMELDAHPFRIAHLLRDVSTIASVALVHKPVQLLMDVAADVPSALRGDSQRLRQVLINLVGNAIKFTEQGEVRVGVRVTDRDDKDIALEVAVHDTGIGIAPEHHERIFSAFTQAESSTTRRYGGTGLGLAISQRIVTLMGAQLNVQSTPGRGSTFSFTLRLQPVDEADMPAEAEHHAAESSGRHLDGLRLLLVEDNLNNQQIACELLEAEGAKVDVAERGDIAVAAVAAASPLYDAVLMDLQMPVMDGLSATREIRHTLGLRDLPIVAVSANAMASDRDACLAAGMNAHIGKPFDLQVLIDTLLQLTGRMSSAATSRAPAAQSVALSPQLMARAHEQGIELESALARLGGKPGPYLRLLESFVNDVRALPDELAQEIRRGDLSAACMRMHTLKGLAATLGVRELSQHAAQAERHLKGPHVTGAANAVDPALEHDLREVMDRTLHDLSELAREISQALEASAPELPPTVDDPAQDVSLAASLRELAGLLRRSDMRAIDVHGRLPRVSDPGWDEALRSLDEAMTKLDFTRAAQVCDSLLRLHLASAEGLAVN